jgi:G patch domain-containing protein 2
LNENFSPSRPHLRRKRKFKRMAVEYETTPSTPQGSSSHPIFPLSINLKKRVIKPSQEFRSNLFFGKRKRPHRERFSEYESFRHSNSVPRQRNGFLHYQKDCSYIEYKSRNRASSMTMSRGAALEKIMPLNKSIVSKIEKISKENQNKLNFYFSPTFPLQTMTTTTTQQQQQQHEPILNFKFGKICANNLQQNQLMSGVDGPTSTAQMNFHENYKKFTTIAPTTTTTTSTANMYESALMKTNGLINNYKIESKRKIKNSLANQNSTHLKHHKHSRRFQLQFDDQNFMDCENMNDNFLSSSSLSSSESETEDTNGSDHEGDDELTDWPGHEAMVNFSRNDLRNVKRCSKLKKIKQDEVLQDDETLMSAEEVQFPLKSPSTLMLQSNSSSNPIDINNLVDTTSQFAQDGSSTSGINADYGSFNFPRVIESEMSGETSNSLLSSCIANEIREIRAGCRRIRDERPGFSIIASFNDELMR